MFKSFNFYRNFAQKELLSTFSRWYWTVLWFRTLGSVVKLWWIMPWHLNKHPSSLGRLRSITFVLIKTDSHSNVLKTVFQQYLPKPSHLLCKVLSDKMIKRSIILYSSLKSNHWQDWKHWTPGIGLISFTHILFHMVGPGPELFVLTGKN